MICLNTSPGNKMKLNYLHSLNFCLAGLFTDVFIITWFNGHWSVHLSGPVTNSTALYNRCWKSNWALSLNLVKSVLKLQRKMFYQKKKKTEWSGYQFIQYEIWFSFWFSSFYLISSKWLGWIISDDKLTWTALIGHWYDTCTACGKSRVQLLYLVQANFIVSLLHKINLHFILAYFYITMCAF